MAVNKVSYGGQVLIDISNDTVTAETLAQGVTAHNKVGDLITGILQAGAGGGLPEGVANIARGTFSQTAAWTTSRKTVTTNAGFTPHLILFAKMGSNPTSRYRLLSTIWFDIGGGTPSSSSSSTDLKVMTYISNTSGSVASSVTTSTNYGISNVTANSFQIASHSSSYQWEASTYYWVAIQLDI